MPRLAILNEARTARFATATPEAFGAASGRALQKFGQEMARVEQAAVQVVSAQKRQKARENAMRFRLALADETDRLLNDPDLDERERKFDAARQRLSETFAPGVFRQDFESNAGIAAEQLRVRLRSGTRRQRVSEGIDSVEFQLDGFAQSIAQADSAEERAQLVAQAASTVEQAKADGLFTDGSGNRLYARFLQRTEEKTRQADFTKDAQLLTDTIIADVDDEGGELPLEKRLDRAREIEDPELRDEVVRRVKVRHDEQRAARREAERQFTEASWSAVLGGAGEEAIVDGVPATTRKQIQDFIARREKNRANGRSMKVETDPMVWDRLVTMRHQDPDSFANLDLWQFRKDLSRSDFNELKGEWEGMRQGVDVKPAISGSDRTFLNDTMRSAGVTDTETQASMRLAFKRAAEAQRDQAGRELTLEERERIAQSMMSEINVPGFMGMTILAFGETKRIGDLTEEDGQRIVENPPDELRRLAIESLRSRGVPEPGPDQVEAAIRALLKRYGVPGVE